MDSCLKPGDKIILSGSIGDHGIAILSFREGYGFESTIKSDVQPLNGMIRKALEIYCRQDAEGMSGIIKALRRLCD